MKTPTLIVLCGLPGSGKTSYAKRICDLYNILYFSSDEIREKINGNASDQSNVNTVFEIMQQNTINSLKSGFDVIYDATNLKRKYRKALLDTCPKEVIKKCYVIWTPIEECIIRDSERDRTVGISVIDRMVKSFQAPYYDEGFDEIKIIKNQWDFDAINYRENILNSMKIPHDNPYHSLNIFEHSDKALSLAHHKTNDSDILKAVEYHDIGKPYCKSFINSRGEKTDIAHYYGHQSVGAYMSYGLPECNPHIAWLISTHMDVYLNTNYYNNLSSHLKKSIDILHIADDLAH